MQRIFASLVSVSILLISLAGGQEPVKPPRNPRIMTGTRQVVLFTSLEKQMMEALQKRDKAALKALLTDDAAVHMPDADQLAGEDWVDSVMSKDFALKAFGIRQVDVADLGNAAVVAYDRIQDSTFKGKPDGGEFFVVDLWKKDGDTWKLADRYVSKVTSAIPQQKDVKPTGKQ
jgi:ketosteroid isomerase-like protein